MNDAIRNDPKQWRNHQMFELIRQQISQLLLQYPELEEDEQLRSDMIEGETDAFEVLQKLEHKRRETDCLMEAIDHQITSLTMRKERFDRREDVMRKLMFAIMQIAHIQKAELPEATLSIRNNPPKVIITDEAALDLPYWHFKKSPDKVKIKKDIEAFGRVAGAELSNAEPSLSIRTK